MEPQIKEEEFKENTRYRLENGVSELDRQNDQLKGVKSIGMDTASIMRSANVDLQKQREIILNTR